MGPQLEASETTSPVVQRRRLRAELRRARLDANLTQEQVASAMDWSLSKLIRIENGTVNISTNDLKAILTHYKIFDEERTADFLALSRGARERSWWSGYRDVAPSKLLQMIEYEAASIITRNYQPLLVPGLLQTEEYARNVYRRLNPQESATRLESLVEVRMRRQELLSRPDAPLLFFIIDQAVVERIVGGKATMRRQLSQLIELAGMPKVTIEVVPFEAGAHPGLLGSFMIYEFPDTADDDVLWLEGPTGDLLSRDNPEEILSFREKFEQLRQISLGPEGSASFLDERVKALS
jgi:transcriptional regulator with XRE-family HTH domain